MDSHDKSDYISSSFPLEMVEYYNAVGQSFNLEMVEYNTAGEALVKTAGKSEKRAEDFFQFVEIKRGTIKIVWVERSKIKHLGNGQFSIDSSKVYYTAIDSFTGTNKRELQSEFEIMTTIKKLIKIEKGSSAYLAIEVEEMKGEKRINAKYTLKADRALGDLEQRLGQKMPLQERLRYGGHILNGLANLHLVDYTHGDIKPENCLIYEHEGQRILKISDFGKTKKLNSEESAIYSGNLRYASPEGRQSQKGDVFGVALILIRILEEEYLDNASSLINIKSEERDMQASLKLRGIEKYLVENKAFFACNEGLSFDIMCRRAKMPFLSQADKDKQTKEIHGYIDTLQKRLAKDGRLKSHQVEALCGLLKNMTEAVPQARISAKFADILYQEIFKEFL